MGWDILVWCQLWSKAIYGSIWKPSFCKWWQLIDVKFGYFKCYNIVLLNLVIIKNYKPDLAEIRKLKMSQFQQFKHSYCSWNFKNLLQKLWIISFKIGSNFISISHFWYITKVKTLYHQIWQKLCIDFGYYNTCSMLLIHPAALRLSITSNFTKLAEIYLPFYKNILNY